MSRGGFGGGGGAGPGGPVIGGMRIGPAQTPRVIKELAIALTVAFLIQVIAVRVGFVQVMDWGALEGERFFHGMLWQPLTSIFFHDDRNLFHLLGNLFLLWMFGSSVAEQLGRRRFFVLFLGGGAAAGLVKMLAVLLLHVLAVDWQYLAWGVGSIGASGAVFVVLAWYCLSWPDREISLLFLPFVFTAGQALPLWFLVEFGFAGDSNVDHAIHLAGALVGWMALKWYRRRLQGGPTRKARKKPPRSHLRLVGKKDDGPVFH